MVCVVYTMYKIRVVSMVCVVCADRYGARNTCDMCGLVCAVCVDAYRV